MNAIAKFVLLVAAWVITLLPWTVAFTCTIWCAAWRGGETCGEDFLSYLRGTK